MALPPFKVGDEVVNTNNHAKGIVQKVTYEPGLKSYMYRIYYEFVAAGKVKEHDTEWEKVDKPYISPFDVPEYDLDWPRKYSKSSEEKATDS